MAERTALLKGKLTSYQLFLIEREVRARRSGTIRRDGETRERSDAIVFSGDTTPSDNLVKLAQGADILVHEVLHKPSLARLLARVPNADRLLEHIVASHTTHIDVGKVAKEAGVKTLVLTHFVPTDDPSITEQMWAEGPGQNFSGKIIVGKDLMEIPT